MISELFLEKAFDEFYDKCKEILRKNIFDKKKLDILKDDIAEFHRNFSETNLYAQESAFQKFVENNLKLYEQYNAINKIEPPYETLDEIQKEIKLKCIKKFCTAIVSKSDIDSYYIIPFLLIKSTLYEIARETDMGRSAIIIDETGQRIDRATEETNKQIISAKNEILSAIINTTQIAIENKELLANQNACNSSLNIDTNKSILILDENRKRLSHEMRQIAAGIRALNESFGQYIFNKNIEAHENKNRNITELFNQVIKRAELYKLDIQGQFDLIDLMTIYQGDEVYPNIKQFDIWKEFFYKLHLVFKAPCSVNNHYLDMPLVKLDRSQLNMHTVTTDPMLLECVLFNVVSNAIKYSYINSKIIVDFTKRTEPEKYIFTITNYGNFLDPYDRSIYERGVRHNNDMGTTVGMGLGLYWCELIITKLGGKIHHECNPVDEPLSKYNIPLMEPFFSRFSNYNDFRKAWDKAYKLGFVEANISEQSYIDIKAKYEDLRKQHIYEKIVNNWSSETINNMSFFRLYTDMQIPTYEIIFKIEIPKLVR